ncbi:MAG TPA: cellulase family glycosylhydrolase [Acidobacteriota bacterium]|nr:cellulase family glycosylhydrolase [Acidobacteriota bacterium]
MRSLVIGFMLAAVAGSALGSPLEQFVRREGDRLFEGDREFRFISFNVPNLHYVEDDLAFERTMPYRFPDEYEIRDALETIRQLGGRVVRTYTLPVYQASVPADTPKYVEGIGKYNETAFRTLDLVLALADETGIRLIIPFINNFQWWGGVGDFAALRGKDRDAFWTDPQLIADFKDLMRYVVNRVNTVTGIPYRQEKAILAWETGNETQCPHAWTREVTAYLRELDPNHLIVDGYLTSVLRRESIDDPNVDIVQTHHYEADPSEMLRNIRRSAAAARGKKPYMLGEFGFISTRAVEAVLDTVVEEGLAGALLWSLRYHHRRGGFFWHSEPAGGDFFKAYHWPGFPSGEPYDERGLMALMRSKAYTVAGLSEPPRPVPKAPRLLAVEDPSALTWQGSVGASDYLVERAESAAGSWRIIGSPTDDARWPYRSLFCDEQVEKGRGYYYRVRARNAAGVSEPSNVVGPVVAKYRVLVDEHENLSQVFHAIGPITLEQDQARRFKEDFHRLRLGDGGAVIYRVAGRLQRIRIFSFAEDAVPRLEIEVSDNGAEFQAAPADVEEFGAGEAEYGYLTPVRYTVGRAGLPTGGYVRLRSRSVVHLSRVELYYSQVD